MSVHGTIIFCDDIRTENNGKLILIGVYGDSLIPAALPQALGLSVHVRLWDLPAGHHNFSVSVSVDEKAVAPSPFDMLVPVASPVGLTQLNIIGVPVQLTKSSTVKCVLSGLPGGETISEALKILPAATPVSPLFIPPGVDTLGNVKLTNQ